MSKNTPKNYYATNTEIAEKFGVSEGAVRNWIKGAKEGRNNLQLEKKKNRYFVKKSEQNEAELARLSVLAKKYKNTNNRKVVEISNTFYNIFSEEEVAEIMSDLEFKRQMKTKYSYMKSKYWDEFYIKATSPVSSVVGELLSGIENEIYKYSLSPDMVNIIDIGPGNALPLKPIVKNFYQENLMNKYITIDISNDMNKLATNNMKEWFPNIKTQTHKKDVEATRLGKVLLESKELRREVANIIFHLGGTVDNHDDRLLVFKNIRNGMVDDDLFIFNFSLENKFHQAQLGYIRNHNGDLMQNWPLSLLGIDVDKCTIKMEYDEKRKCKSKILILDKDYVIDFKLFNNKRRIELNSKEIINIWRHHLISLPVLLKELELSNLQLASLKLDKKLNSGLAFCKIKTDY